MLPEPDVERKSLTSQDIKLIIDKCENDDDKNLVKFVLHTGLRIGAVINLKWDDVRDGLVHVETKRKQQYSLPVSDTALAIIESQPRRDGLDYIWPKRGIWGDGFVNEPWDTQAICGTQH